MIGTEKLSTGLLALTVMILGVSFILSGLWQWSMVALLAASLWWASTCKLGWHWGASLGMAVLVVVASLGTWLGLPFLAMLVAIMLVLSAWDLDAFIERLGAMVLDDATQTLARIHRNRLFLVNGFALALVVLGLTVELRFSFWVTFFLGLGMAFGLNRFLIRIRENARRKEN